MLFDAGLGHNDSKLGEDEVGRTDFVSGKHCCIHLPHSAAPSSLPPPPSHLPFPPPPATTATLAPVMTLQYHDFNEVSPPPPAAEPVQRPLEAQLLAESEVAPRPPPVEDEVDKKRKRRMELNRVAAQKSRKRKKMKVDQLEQSVMRFTHENNQLRAENNDLQAQNQLLRHILERHEMREPARIAHTQRVPARQVVSMADTPAGCPGSKNNRAGNRTEEVRGRGSWRVNAQSCSERGSAAFGVGSTQMRMNDEHPGVTQDNPRTSERGK